MVNPCAASAKSKEEHASPSLRTLTLRTADVDLYVLEGLIVASIRTSRSCECGRHERKGAYVRPGAGMPTVDVAGGGAGGPRDAHSGGHCAPATPRGLPLDGLPP